MFCVILKLRGLVEIENESFRMEENFEQILKNWRIHFV